MYGTNELVHQVTMFIAMPNHLNSFPGTHKVEGELTLSSYHLDSKKC